MEELKNEEAMETVKEESYVPTVTESYNESTSYDLNPEEEYSGSGIGKVIAGALFIGGAIAGGVCLWKRHKAKKAMKAEELFKEDSYDDEDVVAEDDFKEVEESEQKPKEESKKQDDKKSEKKK